MGWSARVELDCDGQGRLLFVRDLAICLDGTIWLPEPDAFPLACDRIVLPDRDLPAMIHLLQALWRPPPS
ncbi:MAG: hypothetical protein KF817_03520 [Phycisphaeraceae bacterium]|nr:hypothetical protein [Phycisphaeraceae bacterium]